MDRRAFVAAAAAAAASLVPLSAHAQQPKKKADATPKTKSISLTDVFPYADRLDNIAPADRSLFQVLYFITMNGAPPAPVYGFAIVGQGQRVPLSFGPDGRVLNPPTAAQIRGKHKVEATAPPGTSFATNLQIRPKTAPALRVPAPELEASLVQLNRAIAKQAGLLRIVAPKMDIVVPTGKDVAGWAVAADGRETPLTHLPKGGPLYFEPAAMKGTVALRFSKVPDALMLGGKG